MSFILDALKKSEGDRQRQAGPALFEVRVAPPRPHFPLWTLVLAGLLGMNALLFGGWLVVRALRPAAEPVPAAVAPAPAAAAAAAAAGVMPDAAGAAPVARAMPTPPGGSAGATRMPSAPRDPELAALDDEPAVEAPPAGRASFPTLRTQSEVLPTRDELHSPAVASLPELRLDLLVYDAEPAKRFVMINLHRLREGDALPEGVRVTRITEEGAELDYNGTRFLLPHE